MYDVVSIVLLDKEFYFLPGQFPPSRSAYVCTYNQSAILHLCTVRIASAHDAALIYVDV